jgi:hypothetical protein
MVAHGRLPLLPRYWAAALLAPLLLAAACLGALAFDGLWLAEPPATAPGSSPAVSLCVSVRLSGSWREAAWWEPVFSARTGPVRRPFVQPRLACGLIPWQSWLPATGVLQTSD